MGWALFGRKSRQPPEPAGTLWGADPASFLSKPALGLQSRSSGGGLSDPTLVPPPPGSRATALMELPVPPETLGRLGGEIARQMLKAAEDYVAGLAAGQAISGFRSALAIPAGPPEASQGALPSRTSRTGRTPETGVVSGSPVGHGNSGGPAGIPQVAPAEGGETAGSDGHGASSDSGPAPGVSSSPS